MHSFKKDSMMDDLTDYVIQQAIDLQACDQKNQDHSMFVTWFSVCYSVKDDERFLRSFERMQSNMLHIHQYNGQEITSCVEREEVFSSEDELPIITLLKSRIPAFELFGNASGWFMQNILVNVMGLMSFMIYCSDWGTDVQQNVNFHCKMGEQA